MVREGVQENSQVTISSTFHKIFQVLDLWKVFVRLGKVWEVSISPRRRRSGLRFGFCGFREVENPLLLENQLHNIFIGNLKIMVNLPKF